MKIFAKSGSTFDRASEKDTQAISHLLSMAFGFDTARALEYIDHAGLETIRMVRAPSGVAQACAALLPTAHAFGGVDIPAANIAHVAIAPEARGQGLASPLVDALCEDARKQGALMVSLFASARPVYRKCGFELAGSEIVYQADTATLPSRTSVDFFPIALSDERMVASYAAKTSVEAGLLSRQSVHWKELVRAPKTALAAYGAGGQDDALLGAYVIVDASDHNHEVLYIRDWYAANGEMAEAILCFVGRFRSVYPTVQWHGGPQDELVAAMPDKGWKLVHQEEWLARILEPAKALQRRRYGAHDAVVGIRITRDNGPDIELNLAIAGGEATVADGMPAATASISVDEPFFASLFTGFTSASQLARRGRLSGDREAVQQCDLIFAGPRPWVAEHF